MNETQFVNLDTPAGKIYNNWYSTSGTRYTGLLIVSVWRGLMIFSYFLSHFLIIFTKYTTKTLDFFLILKFSSLVNLAMLKRGLWSKWTIGFTLMWSYFDAVQYIVIFCVRSHWQLGRYPDNSDYTQEIRIILRPFGSYPVNSIHSTWPRLPIHYITYAQQC